MWRDAACFLIIVSHVTVTHAVTFIVFVAAGVSFLTLSINVLILVWKTKDAVFVEDDVKSTFQCHVILIFL
jgi:hypothetical protein